MGGFDTRLGEGTIAKRTESPVRRPVRRGLDSGRVAVWRRAVWGGLAAILVTAAHRAPFLQAVEDLLYDARVEMVASREPVPDDIVVVAIDGESLERMQDRLGRWPWPRAVFAGLVEYCGAASVIGLDILFAQRDPDPSPGDDLLAEAVRAHGRVVVGSFFSKAPSANRLSAQAVPSLGRDPAWQVGLTLPVFAGAELPYPEVLASAASVAHVNYVATADGVVREYQTALVSAGAVVPSLAVAVVSAHRGQGPDPAALAARRVLQWEKAEAPLDEHGRFRLRFPAMPYQGPRYRVADVLDSFRAELAGRPALIPREAFRGKIVLIGSTTVGLAEDRKVTPVARSTPGVVINAVATDNLLRGAVWRMPSRAGTAAWVFVACLVPALAPLRRPITLGGFLVGEGVVYVLLVVAAAVGWRWMLPVAGPLLGMGIGGVVLGVQFWYSEIRHRRELERMDGAKQRFTDMLVHDLKGRAGSIGMSLDLIGRSIPEGDEDAQRFLQMAATTTRRLLSQIHSLLDIRKIQEGQMPLNRSTLDLGRLLDDCREEYQGPAQVMTVFLVRSAADPPSVTLEADGDLVSRVLGNLVWNALQYAQEGTSIELGMEAVHPDWVSFYVSNHGPVMPPESQAQVFELFETGWTEDSQRKAHSSGLGLAFCRMACEAHGGNIRILSPWLDGQGVKVVASLPVRVSSG